MVSHAAVYTMTVSEEMMEVLKKVHGIGKTFYSSYYKTAVFTMRALPCVFVKWAVHAHPYHPQDCT